MTALVRFVENVNKGLYFHGFNCLADIGFFRIVYVSSSVAIANLEAV